MRTLLALLLLFVIGCTDDPVSEPPCLALGSFDARVLDNDMRLEIASCDPAVGWIYLSRPFIEAAWSIVPERSLVRPDTMVLQAQSNGHLFDIHLRLGWQGEAWCGLLWSYPSAQDVCFRPRFVY